MLSAGVRWALAVGLAVYLLGTAAGMQAAMAHTTSDQTPHIALATVALALALAAIGGDLVPPLFLALIVALVVGQLALELRGGHRFDSGSDDTSGARLDYS